MRQIIRIQLQRVEKLLKEQKIYLDISPEACDYLSQLSLTYQRLPWLNVLLWQSGELGEENLRCPDVDLISHIALFGDAPPMLDGAQFLLNIDSLPVFLNFC